MFVDENEGRRRKISWLYSPGSRARPCQPSVMMGLAWYNVARPCHIRHGPFQLSGQSGFKNFHFSPIVLGQLPAK